MTFGIPVEVLPVTRDGEFKHKIMFSRRKFKEQQEAAALSDESFHADLPARYDVLFEVNRIKSIWEHKAFTSFYRHREEYHNANVGKKSGKWQVKYWLLFRRRGLLLWF
jgi:hypothetical protein